eukprot:TRINITY_DN76423_c0_g1_i1.p1 TRINITY_DN76423_c0_g1~~TRINITY_DN76423_c0_g1_i1.p1  ORF type:complete len:254 (-),score=24.37 TRINITY_DN76423_c0_g1_i1:27-788(-)
MQEITRKAGRNPQVQEETQPLPTKPTPAAAVVSSLKSCTKTDLCGPITKRARKMLQVSNTTSPDPEGTPLVSTQYLYCDGKTVVRTTDQLLDTGAEGQWETRATVCADAPLGRFTEYRYNLKTHPGVTFLSQDPQKASAVLQARALTPADVQDLEYFEGLAAFNVVGLPGYFGGVVYAGEERDSALTGMGVMNDCVTVIAGKDAHPLQLAYQEGSDMRMLMVQPGTAHFLSATQFVMGMDGGTPTVEKRHFLL